MQLVKLVFGCFLFHYAYLVLAVFAESLNALAVGLPLAPIPLIRSPDPFLILSLLAWIFA